MRRSHCEIKDHKEMERILDAATIGRMATLDPHGYPYITPVNFVYYRGCVYFHSAPEGEKLQNMARHPKVCFEVDIPLAYLDASFNSEREPCRVHQLYHCVMIRGVASVIPDGELKTAVLNALVQKHERGSEVKAVDPQSPSYKRCLVVEIRPEGMTGKSDLLQNKPKDGARREVAEHLARRGLPGDLEAIRAMGYGRSDE